MRSAAAIPLPRIKPPVHAVYTGAIAELQGRGASLVTPAGGCVFARFDDSALVLDDVWVGYGWHRFAAADFAPDNPQ